jgi:prepilin-type N-terminal cleavage/methylation domain-containing protein
MENQNLSFENRGFTLIELIAVVVIIAIAAMLAIPMFSSAASTQVRVAADMIAADIEYAKSMAISRQETYTVIFDESAESYSIEDEDGVISHPVTHGDYVVNFKTDSRVDKVNIVDADFGSSEPEQVSFTYLGSPDNGGSITLSVGTRTVTITVETMTGYVSISQ